MPERTSFAFPVSRDDLPAKQRNLDPRYLESDAARTAVQQYWRGLETDVEVYAAFYEEMSNRVPLKVVCYGKRVALECHRTSASGKIAWELDGLVPTSLLEGNDHAKSFEFPGLEDASTQFLRNVAGLRSDWESAAGFLTSGLFQYTEDDDEFDWGYLGDWEGAFEIYADHSGNSILLRSDGAIGWYTHDNDDEDEPVEPIAESLPSFIEIYMGRKEPSTREFALGVSF